MAWTNITNAQLAIGAPVRSIDLLALRDNITAQANGDAGAPKQQTAGIADNAVTAVKINYGNGLGANGTQVVVACPTTGSVGSYAFVGPNGALPNMGPGNSISGGILYYAACVPGGLRVEGSTLSGTWRSMGNARPDSSGQPEATVACRIV